MSNICFSDEATFFINGCVNKQNCRYWSDENPHVFKEGNTQKINVWAGILGNAIIGPIFIDENLTGEVYLHLHENVIDPSITNELEHQMGENILQENQLYFQQDGAMGVLNIYI